MLPVEGAADATATAIEDMGVDHGGGHVAVTEIVLVLQESRAEMGAEGIAQGGGEHGDPVRPSLPVAHHDLAAREVDVLDAQSAAFHEPQAGPIEKRGHDAGDALEAREDRVDFRPREDDREPRRAPGPYDALEPGEPRTQHLVVQKEEGRERLVLGRGTDAPLGREAGEEIADLTLSHVRGVALAVVQDESPDPSDVGLLGPGTEVSAAKFLAHLIEELRRVAARVRWVGLAEFRYEHAPSPFGGAVFRARGDCLTRLYA